MPTLRDWYNWVEANPTLTNLGMRIPPDVVVLDVDSYKENGHANWLELDGPNWPQTYRTSARGFDDGMGHWFYLVPAGKDIADLPSAWGGIECLRTWHRYTMAPGSYNGDADAVYEMVDMRSGAACDFMPETVDIPVMPEWMWEKLTTAKRSFSTGSSRVRMTDEDDDACAYVASIELPDWSEGSRYDAARDLAWHLIQLDHEGHRGANAALLSLRDSYITELENNPRRTGDRPDAEFDRMVEQGRQKSTPRGFEQPCSCDLAAWEAEPEKDPFWDTRPVLTEIREYARSKMVPPWAMLGAWLAFLAAEVPPSVRLPGYVGSESSLNFYVALVGHPSSGKSVAVGAARDAGALFSHLLNGWTSRIGGLGSGEGVAKMYGQMKTHKDDLTGEKKEQMEWVEPRRVVFINDEIESIESVQSRGGNTLGPIFRTAWTGGDLSLSYSGEGKKIAIPAHSYRMCVITGAQPGAVDWLLREHDRGTPQRYLWAAAEGGVEYTDFDHTLVPTLSLKPEVVNGWDLVVPFPDDIRVYVRKMRYLSANGLEGAPPQHSILQTMKVAALLALADWRTEVNHEDWSLASRIVAHSMSQIERLRQYQIEQKSAAIEVLAAEADQLDSHKVSAAVRRYTNNLIKRAQAHATTGTDHVCNKTCLKGVVNRPAAGMTLGALRREVFELARKSGQITGEPNAFRPS